MFSTSTVKYKSEHLCKYWTCHMISRFSQDAVLQVHDLVQSPEVTMSAMPVPHPIPLVSWQSNGQTRS